MAPKGGPGVLADATLGPRAHPIRWNRCLFPGSVSSAGTLQPGRPRSRGRGAEHHAGAHHRPAGLRGLPDPRTRALQDQAGSRPRAIGSIVGGPVHRRRCVDVHSVAERRHPLRQTRRFPRWARGTVAAATVRPFAPDVQRNHEVISAFGGGGDRRFPSIWWRMRGGAAPASVVASRMISDVPAIPVVDDRPISLPTDGLRRTARLAARSGRRSPNGRARFPPSSRRSCPRSSRREERSESSDHPHRA